MSEALGHSRLSNPLQRRAAGMNGAGRSVVETRRFESGPTGRFPINVRYGSKADYPGCWGRSALPSEADIQAANCSICFAISWPHASTMLSGNRLIIPRIDSILMLVRGGGQ